MNARRMKLPAFMALVMIIVLAVVTVVMADDIYNNLDTSIDSVAEVMALNVGGSNGTTQLYVLPTNGDGKQGCNLNTNKTTLVVSISSSNTSVATVSPSSITFETCGDTPTLTITPLSQGSTTISVSQTSNDTGATFNFAPASFTVNVAPPANTAPTVKITGVTGGASYETGSVPAATCNVTDAEDGNSSFPATLSAITGPLSAYGLGEQTASCSYTDAGKLTASASVTYGIVDTTKPVITFVSRTPANGNGWNNDDVTVTWSCSDSGSGAVAATVSQTVSKEGADQSATGTCIDHAGNTAPDTQSGINIDRTAPTATASASPAANANGWNNKDVTVNFSGTDGLSGIASCSVDVVLSSEGAGQSASGTCTDKAGNVSVAASIIDINIDKTAPTASASASPAANGFGWNNTDVTVSFSGSDSLSGNDFCDKAVVLSAEAALQSASGTCTDKAGNVSAAATASGINIDKTAPTVSLIGGPANGASYYFGFVPAAPTCSASDALSGLVSACEVIDYSSAVGTHTVSASASDKADNSASASATYTVLAWTLKGFYQPVDMNGVYNTVKNGSTVPFKFEIFAGPTELTDVAYVKGFNTYQVTCKESAQLDEIETVATGNTVLRYDATAGQFVYNWKTPSKAGNCYHVVMTTQDGSYLDAFFKLK